MKRDISDEGFARLSKEAQKRYVVSLIIKNAKSTPVEPPSTPLAIVMAGIPGAGKTEFLDSFESEMRKRKAFNAFVRVDLDQLITVYPGYTPKTYNKFRGQGNTLLARCIDELRQQKHNIMLDGTFSGSSGSSVRNVEKLLNAGYAVFIVYMYDDAETAWRYTQLREVETDRGIDREGFIASCANISTNLQAAIQEFGDHSAFSIDIIRQKKLRDKNYDIITNQDEVDAILDAGYNIDKLKETL